MVMVMMGFIVALPRWSRFTIMALGRRHRDRRNLNLRLHSDTKLFLVFLPRTQEFLTQLLFALAHFFTMLNGTLGIPFDIKPNETKCNYSGNKDKKYFHILLHYHFIGTNEHNVAAFILLVVLHPFDITNVLAGLAQRRVDNNTHRGVHLSDHLLTFVLAHQEARTSIFLDNPHKRNELRIFFLKHQSHIAHFFFPN